MLTSNPAQAGRREKMGNHHAGSAISLKRIADLMGGSSERVGGVDALCMIADRMPTA